MKPLVSAIILNWNRKKDTAEAIKSIQKQTYKKIEIIVVDNFSTDGSIEYLKNKFKNIRIIENDKNYGLSGWNYGMKAAKGKYLFLLASDGLIEKKAISKHVSKLNNNKKLGVSCSSTYVWPTKTYLAPNRAIDGNNKTGYMVTYFDGNGICLRREVFKKTGGYTKDYFICLEELEWAVRILKSGYDIRCFTDIIVYNKKSKIAGNYRNKQGYWYTKNWLNFYFTYLPIKSMFDFLRLHIKSFFIKTGRKGRMTKADCIRGIIEGTILIPKFILNRNVLDINIINRIKLDLFPNDKHLYIYE